MQAREVQWHNNELMEERLDVLVSGDVNEYKYGNFVI